MQKRKHKSGLKSLVITSLLLITLFSTTVFAYAYWQNIKDGSGSGNGDINIGEGDEIITNIEVSDATSNKKLVPTGLVSDENETDEIVLEFNVYWKAESTAESVNGILSVSYDLTALDAVYEKLLIININFDSSISLNKSAAKVTITISLKEPENKQEYDIIANTNIKIPFSFQVTV